MLRRMQPPRYFFCTIRAHTSAGAQISRALNNSIFARVLIINIARSANETGSEKKGQNLCLKIAANDEATNKLKVFSSHSPQFLRLCARSLSQFLSLSLYLSLSFALLSLHFRTTSNDDTKPLGASCDSNSNTSASTLEAVAGASTKKHARALTHTPKAFKKYHVLHLTI